MPESTDSCGAVTRQELEELADLFDRYEFAFDPLSTEAKEAEVEFENRVNQTYETKVKASYPKISFVEFRCKMRSACREYLRKNRPR